MMTYIKNLFSVVTASAILFFSSSFALAADYWIWGESGYNYYIVTEKSSLLDEWSARARMKEVSADGKAYTYDLYMWEMKGELWSSTRRQDLGTRNGRPVQGHNTMIGKAYDYMMNNYR